MPAVYHSRSTQAILAIRQRIAGDLNAGATGHVRHTQNEVPIDSQRLHDSTRVEAEADAGSLRAVVAQGGIEVRGKLVDYAEEVELGANAQPNFVPGMDVGRRIILDRGRSRGR
jgi:hypothetical protein